MSGNTLVGNSSLTNQDHLLFVFFVCFLSLFCSFKALTAFSYFMTLYKGNILTKKIVAFCHGIDSTELRRKLARIEEEHAEKIRESNEEVSLN